MNKTVVMAYYWDSLTVSGGLLVSIPGAPLAARGSFAVTSRDAVMGGAMCPRLNTPTRVRGRVPHSSIESPDCGVSHDVQHRAPSWWRGL